MKRYRNIKTGVVIDSPSKIIGKAWKLVTDKENASEIPETDGGTKYQYVEEEINLEEMTKPQLIEFAKEHDIEVNDKDTKAVMIEKIAKAFG